MTTTTPTTITTEDGSTLAPGDRAFNYYDQKAGKIGDDIDSAGWFTFTHDDGTRSSLNGERVCSLTLAAGKGWHVEPEPRAGAIVEPAPVVEYANAVDCWLRLTPDAATTRRSRVAAILLAAAELADDELAAALAEISDEYVDLARQDDALRGTDDYLYSMIAEHEQQARIEQRADKHMNAATHRIKAGAYTDARRVLDIAREV